MKIDAYTGGRLQFELLYQGEHPYTSAEILRALKDNVCDAITTSHKSAGDEPMLKVSTAIPFLIPRGDFELEHQIQKSLGQEQMFLDIFRKWNGEYLATFDQGAQHLYMKDTLIRNPEDIEGKKVRVAHTTAESWINAMGGVPIHVEWSETYTALATGLVDGVTTSFTGAFNTGLIEHCSYVTWVSTNFTPYRFVANKQSLEALPADVRDGFLAGLEAVDDWWYGGAVREVQGLLINSFFTHGVTAGTISLDWRAELRAGAFEYCWKPLLDGAGSEGWQMFDLIVKLIEAEGYEVPGYVPQS